MKTERTGAVVIGAGVVGLACARALASRGIETIIAERHRGFGRETSSRNSEVIHAGLYYAPDTLKARFCVAGNRLLQEYCAERGIGHRRCGKLIVATQPAQVSYLEKLRQQAEQNGTGDTVMLTAAEARRLEPELQCVAALLSPSMGIVDSHALMLSLLGDAEAGGAVLCPTTAVEAIAPQADGLRLALASGGETLFLDAGLVVNSAGLSSVALAQATQGYPAAQIPKARFAKGNYYALAGRAPFSRLIYPVPEEGGLGIHLTLDLGGQARFGPDVEWIDTPDYAVDPRRADGFYAEARKYWPKLPDNSLRPAYSGVRPKVAGPGDSAADFLIRGPDKHGIAGLVSLFGIESPGLTSCLPIAEYVCGLLGV